MAGEFLNFAEISKDVAFHRLLNWLNIPFKETDKELKGEYFIVSKEKNQYFNTKDKTQKGSVINFLSHHKQIDLRSAASEILKQFLSTPSPKAEEKTIPLPELHYTEQLLTYDCTKELAEQYEVGLVKKHSIMAGHITFRVYKPDGVLAGHVGYKDGNWKYPKDFKRSIWNLHRLPEAEFLFVVPNPFDALKIASFGYPHVVSLLGNSMTDDQLQQLIDHEYLQGITLIHKDPMNIVQRVAKHLYIRYFVPSTSIREMDSLQFAQLFNNPS